MLAVGISYRQTIRAYPQGGRSYIVASEELGRVPGLMAAAGLLIDYVMTVAVSIASGVAAITSAYPPMQPATVWIGVGVIVILLAGNLRGVRQAGAMFAAPTYAFIAAIAALVVAGAGARRRPRVPPRPGPPPGHRAGRYPAGAARVRGRLHGHDRHRGHLQRRAGVQSDRWRNARITLSWMTGLLIGMFGGVLMITRLAGIVPVASQTMLSQLAHLGFGDSPMSRAGLLARIVVLERDFQPGRTAVILARQPSPRASPVTLVMCPGTPLRPAVGTAPKPPASLAVPRW